MFFGSKSGGVGDLQVNFEIKKGKRSRDMRWIRDGEEVERNIDFE